MTAPIPDDDDIVNIAPLGRKGSPQEVADAILFLCSPKASFIQGVALVSLSLPALNLTPICALTSKLI